MYVSPSSDLTYFNSVIDYLDFSFVSVIVLGHFNCPDIDWPTLSGDLGSFCKLCDFVFCNNLTQEISVPTHIRGGILDLVISNYSHLGHFSLL